MRALPVSAALAAAVIVLACGGGASSSPGEVSASPGVPADEAGARPSAPGFELELADGLRFDLDEADKPVYLVFWAEW